MNWIEKNIPEDVADYLFNIRITSLPARIGVYQRNVRPDVIVDFDLLEEQLEEARESGISIRREDLKDMINADPLLIELEKDIIMDTRAEEKLRAVVRALQVKSEHLRSLAGFKREEKRSSR